MTQFNDFLLKLLRVLKLDAELEDTEAVKDTINKAIVFRGTNLWILIFAIVVASVGLNMNSTAVIIGAMLISPLMGPINGIGFAIATYNTNLLKRSLKNFAFAVSASIVASTIYFLLSPVSNAQSELLARTSPTIFDVLIALFGGFAGIVAIISKNKGTVISGVAIATALMPPLCTVGYGIAIGNPSYFLGAFYLFIINSVFIALASMIVTQVLKFPKQEFISPKYKKVTKWTLWIVIGITVIPSVYLGYTLVKKEKFQNAADLYIQDVSHFKNNFLLRNKINADKRTVELIYGGNFMTPSEKEAIQKEGEQFGLKPNEIKIIQGLKMNDFKNEFSEIMKLRDDFSKFEKIIDSRDSIIASLKNTENFGAQLLKEIKALEPDIQSVIFNKTKLFEDGRTANVTFVRLASRKTIDKRSKATVKSWMLERIPGDSLIVVFED